jgi:hypothetical protein
MIPGSGEGFSADHHPKKKFEKTNLEILIFRIKINGITNRLSDRL